MASSFPSSIDSFPDPLANSPLNAPSHSALHQDVNDAVEKVEVKLGLGSSPASSSVAGQVLRASGSGNTAWSDIVVGDIDATGRAVNDVIVADGAGNAAWSAAAGLWLVRTVTVGSGVSSIPVTSCFSSSYTNYRVVMSGVDASSDELGFYMTLSGSTGSTYSSAIKWVPFSTGTMDGGQLNNSATGWLVGLTGNLDNTNAVFDIYQPFTTRRTNITTQGAQGRYMIYGGGSDSNTASSTGFTIIGPVGMTFTGGTIRVYGYKD